MKILFIAPLPPPYGGIANWVQIMLEHINATSDEVEVLNIAPRKRSTEGRKLFDRIVISGFDMFRKAIQLKKRVKEFRPDTIHMTTSGSIAIIRDLLLLRIAKKFGIRTVYHIHFGTVPELEKSSLWIWKLFLKAINMASAVIAIDGKTYNCLIGNMRQEKAFFVPNPINMNCLPQVPCVKKKLVVFLGWLVPTKGIEELITAWNIIGKDFSQYELKIIGPVRQEYLTELIKIVKVDNISFTGELEHDEAMGILANSKVFILPSYTEGFPNGILEAMALKNVVIASDVGAIPQMLEGDCGVVINPKSEEEIITALREVLSDEEYIEVVAENALNKVKSEYAIEKVYELYKEIWENDLENIGNT